MILHLGNWACIIAGIVIIGVEFKSYALSVGLFCLAVGFYNPSMKD